MVLPLALDWSASGVVRDLDDPVKRRIVYEIVLTVGTAADVENMLIQSCSSRTTIESKEAA